MKNAALRWTSRALLGLGLTLLVACGTTLEKQQDRFKRNQDTIEALLAKHPKMKDAVAEKLKGFQAERDQILKAGGEDAKTNLARLNSRMEEFVSKLDPSLANPASAASAGAASQGAKLAPASGAPALGAPGSAAPMSAAPMSAAPMSAAPALGGKLGGAPVTAPPVAPATVAPASAAPVTAAPATAAPVPGGKLGGGAPAGSQPAAPPVKPGPAAGQSAP
ncbi:MAG: hypothetical protein R3F60_12985 [bacterium]